MGRCITTLLFRNSMVPHGCIVGFGFSPPPPLKISAGVGAAERVSHYCLCTLQTNKSQMQFSK